MLRNTQPTMIKVDGRTCFNFENDVVMCLTEDDLALDAPHIVTDSQYDD